MDSRKSNSSLEKDDREGSIANVQSVEAVSRSRWSKLLHVPRSENGYGGGSSNRDFDPVPYDKRTWSSWAFFAYWMADAWAVSNWQVGSSMVAVGMSWRLALGITVLGNAIMGLVITVNGRLGSTLHVPFPVLIRMSFGYLASYFCVFSRAVLAIFWLGIQTVTGGQCVNVLINAMSPSWRNYPNHLPVSAGITSAGMISYFVYFCLQIPFLLIPYHRIQWFFACKAVIAPAVFFAVFGSTIVKGGSTLTGVESNTLLSGSTLAWAFLGNLNSVLGNYATLGLNISDFSRYSRTKKAQDIQVFVIPFIFTIVGLLGILTAAASVAAYPELSKGEAIWNPTVIVDSWSLSGTARGRAASAFAAIGLIIVTIGINISANSISAANDLVAMAPKYINIRRGQLLAAVIGGWVFVPWVVLASAAKFLSFMAGYTIFLGPMTGILMTDYYLVRKKIVSVPNMYDFDGIYQYVPGAKSNWRAIFALLCGFAPPLPGLVNYITPSIKIATGATRLFDIGYIYSFTVASVLYYALMHFFPATNTFVQQLDLGDDKIAANDDEMI